MFKLNASRTIANKLGTGEWHNVESSTEYLAWLAEGNTPEPADPVPDPTIEIAKAKLREIDLASIRALREYVAAQPNAPQIVKDKEAAAAVERGELL